MHKLRALVEKGGIVFVGLDHEKRRRAELRRYPEVTDAADQETGREPSILENPRQHGAGGGLTVGAADRQHAAVAQDMIGEPLRPGGVAQTAVEHRLDGGVAAAQGVAHNHQVRRRVEVPGGESSRTSIPAAASSVLIGG